jgi:hypothetical protein
MFTTTATAKYLKVAYLVESNLTDSFLLKVTERHQTRMLSNRGTKSFQQTCCENMQWV